MNAIQGFSGSNRLPIRLLALLALAASLTPDLRADLAITASRTLDFLTNCTPHTTTTTNHYPPHLGLTYVAVNDVTPTSAVARSWLSSDGNQPTLGGFCYGPTDGGETFTNWAQTVVVGPVENHIDFYATFTNLTPGAVYYTKAWATNASGAVWSYDSVRFQTDWGIPVYVDDSATGANTGLSWADAYTSLTNGLRDATAYREVWVASGTYFPPGVLYGFSLTEPVQLYGGFAGHESSRSERPNPLLPTILSADVGVPGDDRDNAGNIMTANPDSDGSTIDGFIFEHTANSVLHSWALGLNATTTVANCTFRSNFTGTWGAVCDYGANSYIVSCRFENNRNLNGAGAYRSSYTPRQPTRLDNCVFVNNTSRTGAGAVFLEGTNSNLFRNCTFARNSAPSANSVRANGTTAPIFENCIFWDEGGAGGGIAIATDARPSLRHCNVRGGFHPDPQNVGVVDAIVDVDPKFKEIRLLDVSLRVDSPCIDAGSANAPPTDIAGTPRPQGEGIDLGAYEVVDATATTSTSSTTSLTSSTETTTTTSTTSTTTATPVSSVKTMLWIGGTTNIVGTNTIPDIWSFEDHANETFIFGSFRGAYGWTGLETRPEGEALVFATEPPPPPSGYPLPASPHHYALYVDGQASRLMDFTRALPRRNVLVDCLIKPYEQQTGTPTLPAGAQMAAFLNSNGLLVVRHSNYTADYKLIRRWTTLDHAPVAPDTWVRLTIMMNYGGDGDFAAREHFFTIALNGTLLPHPLAYTDTAIDDHDLPKPAEAGPGETNMWFLAADSGFAIEYPESAPNFDFFPGVSVRGRLALDDLYVDHADMVTTTTDSTTSTSSTSTAPGMPVGNAMDQSGLTWTGGGNRAWFGQSNVTHDGVDAAQSGSIAHNQTSWTQTTIMGGTSIGFWWKLSAETNDTLTVSLDGISKLTTGGTQAWHYDGFYIPSGVHTVRWTYAKNDSLTQGSDAAWVDGLAVGLFGAAKPLGRGWYWSPWFGFYFANFSPWLYHNEHGWIYPFGQDPGSVVFYDSDMGTFWWTSETLYAFLYRFSDNAWMWYAEGSANPRWLLNLHTGSWESK